MDKLDIHIGNRLKQRRLELGFSRAELSKRTGVSLRQIREYENGRQSLKVSVLHKICRELSVEYSCFFLDFKRDVIYNCSNNDITSDEIGKLTKIYREIDDTKIRLMLLNIAKEACKFSKNRYDCRLDDGK
ncbi:MAG: helix-turn-helix domain-containing protein [Holosporaceae bacterium]|nr:helix-turn-helix domain-containing protein [Holosporaceae bacterium]